MTRADNARRWRKNNPDAYKQHSKKYWKTHKTEISARRSKANFEDKIRQIELSRSPNLHIYLKVLEKRND